MKASVSGGWVGGGKKVAVNVPVPLFLSEDEQFVVRFMRHLVAGEDLLLSGRSGAVIGQVASHVHDFVNGKTTFSLRTSKKC